jgi:hypothetical protein
MTSGYVEVETTSDSLEGNAGTRRLLPAGQADLLVQRGIVRIVSESRVDQKPKPPQQKPSPKS